MSATSRTKGQCGERELAALIREHTGWDVRRRVRNHAGDSDLLGVPGWSVEVKRHRTALPGEVARWWAQTVEQAALGEWPVLFYRADRCEWRAVFPLAAAMNLDPIQPPCTIEWTVTTSVQAWAAVAREAVTAEAA